MKFERRLENLEEIVLKTKLNSKLDAELSEWFKTHPEYQPFAQPEHNEVLMPDHLCTAFRQRIEYIINEKNYPLNLCSLIKLWGNIYP